ncbi:hypothetical protein I316_00274 [Kwoniella heveanensis BCC8398]|uniref:Uncharacterized protein n=1 Tax=Kwoniella heveanensis BCC8398 TaxID=1296120 RepID=A0A1B9H459_9TREE|nr:hypothetical protein I316_00274 [Kwoniella heveanensis BCC8398]
MELAFRKYSFNSALIAFDPAEVEEYRSTASGIQHLDVRCDAETDARMEGIIHSGDGTERWLKVDALLDRVRKYRQERSTTHRLLGDGRLEQTDRTPLSAENSAPAKGATTPTGGSTDAWLLDKSGLKMMRSKLQALSAGIEYAADNPVSVYITRRVLEECASVMSRCQTIMQANCSTARTNLGLPSSATVTDIKSRLRGKKDPVLRKARETIVEWEQNLEGYAALMPEVVGTVLSQVEADYKKRRRTSRHSDPDTSEAALITVEAQNNWRDWRQKYSHLQDGIDYGNPNAPLTSFGINKSEMFKPDVRKSAQASLRELTTPVGYTPTLSRNARTAAFNAIDEILELRTAARAEMAQYISELEGTLNAPDRGNSDQDYSSILEAERAYLESSKAKADRNRLKDRKDRFSQVTYGTQDYEKWTSEARDAVLHEIDGKAKSLASMTADDPSENAMYGALARQAELDLLKLKRTVEQALESGTRMSNRDYDAARKPLVSQSTQAMKELEGTAYEGASTLLEVGKIREALQPRASEEPSGQSATEPEETFAEALSNHEDWTDNARNDWSQLVLDEEDAAGKSVATTDISGKSTATPLTWAQIASKK